MNPRPTRNLEILLSLILVMLVVIAWFIYLSDRHVQGSYHPFFYVPDAIPISEIGDRQAPASGNSDCTNWCIGSGAQVRQTQGRGLLAG